MSEAIRRMGIAFGKLGLSTDAELIKRRGEGARKAASEIEIAGISPLLQAAFNIGSGDARFAFLASFKDDPTFDVRPGDKEALLLAGAIADLVMEGNQVIGGKLALCTITCGCLDLRRPEQNLELIAVAKTNLARFQGGSATRPSDQKYLVKPDAIKTSISAITSNIHPQFSVTAPHVVAALNAVVDYAEEASEFAARSDNQLLIYIKGLEEEMRVYWWVTGGWSTEADKAFWQLPLDVAALCAGEELALKHSSAYGLFAAPALINLILERGRATADDKLVLANVVRSMGSGWRKTKCSNVASGPLAALLPVTVALGLSAETEDAEDWKPRFRRMIGIEAEMELPASDLALQYYRERLVTRALS